MATQTTDNKKNVLAVIYELLTPALVLIVWQSITTDIKELKVISNSNNAKIIELTEWKRGMEIIIMKKTVYKYWAKKPDPYKLVSY